MGVFVVPDLLGGARYMLAGNLIQQQFFTSHNPAFGAAVSWPCWCSPYRPVRLRRPAGRWTWHEERLPAGPRIRAADARLLYVPMLA